MVGGVFFLWYWFLHQPKIEELAKDIQIGMTQAELEAKMGQPQIVENSGRRLAWFDGSSGVGVDLDAGGRVLHKTPVQRVSMFHYFAYKLGWR
jgi:hypothetical protein